MKLPDPSLLTEQNIAQLSASLTGLAPEKRSLVARDVLAAARTGLLAPVHARDSAILKQLRELRRTAERRPVRTDEISDDLCPALGVEDSSQLVDLLTTPDRFLAALDTAISEFASIPETILDRRGGRRRDPRIDNFAFQLVRIYWLKMGASPSFTQDKETGDLIGPFGLSTVSNFETG